MLIDLALKDVVTKLHSAGFVDISSISLEKKKDIMQSGWAMVVDNPILSGVVHDCSLLHVNPYVLLRPMKIEQLKIIVILCVENVIPITFAGGKTGLSGGFLNPFVVVDMESLSSLLQPYTINEAEEFIIVDQNVTVAEIIRRVHQDTQNRFIFPAQPSSSFKLPVQIGGLIATNASGVIAGKMGAIKEWILSVEILTPLGERKTIQHQDPELDLMVGGEGRYGIVLNAKIRIAPSELTYNSRLLFGDDLENAFRGLQAIQDEKIFPLSSEFILSESTLPGEFGSLFKDRPVTWAILLRGTKKELDGFEKHISQYAPISSLHLSEDEYQKYLEERTALATQTRSQDAEDAFILYPGFEDVLMQPQYAYQIFNEVNQLLAHNGFPKVMVGYGHINFRRGQGILMHLRIPVSINKLLKDRETMYRRIATTVAEMNVTFIHKYHIRPKAEHAIGMLFPWHNRNQLKSIEDEIAHKKMFPLSHFVVFKAICKKLAISIDESFSDNDSIRSLEEYYFSYLMGTKELFAGDLL